jgi:hypothetical protein
VISGTWNRGQDLLCNMSLLPVINCGFMKKVKLIAIKSAQLSVFRNKSSTRIYWVRNILWRIITRSMIHSKLPNM